VHPQKPDCVYIVPVESDEFRCTCDGRLRVYRTRNAGASWEPLTRGLPQKGAYETILRDAMTADSFDPAGIYFGTRSGQLYASRDEGKSWQRLLEGLPPVVCIRSAIFAEPGASLRSVTPKSLQAHESPKHVQPPRSAKPSKSASSSLSRGHSRSKSRASHKSRRPGK
jgi:hypothetical protein